MLLVSVFVTYLISGCVAQPTRTSIKQRKKAIVVQGKANNITQDAVKDVTQAQQDNRTAKDSNYQKVEKKVSDIKKDYNTKISNTTDPTVSVQLIREKEVQVSQVRISALWSNYCKAEPQDADCTGVI